MPFKAGVWPIPKGRVKLPEPAVSDYIIPMEATPSSNPATTTLTGNYQFSGWVAVLKYGTTSETISGPAATSWDISKSVPGDKYNELDFDITSPNVDLTHVDTLMLNYYISKPLSPSASITFEIEGTGISTSTNNPGVTGHLTLDVSGLQGEYKIHILVKYTEYPTLPDGNYEFRINSLAYRYSTSVVTDNDTSTLWSPSTSNPGEWIYIDAGAPKIISGLRVYWGSNVPNAFTVEVSTDATNWTPVYKQKSPPQPNSWQEIGFYATYARYIRIYLDDQGANPVEIGEVQYYSSLVERVASEHGHGSGPEPWMRGANVRLRYMSKFANIQSRISSLQRDLQKSKVVNVEHVQELAGIVQDLKELVKLLHM